MHELMDMRTNSCIVAFGNVAIETEDLQVVRESFPLDSDVETISGIMGIASVFRAVVIDMIQCQEGRAALPTASAFTSVMGQDGFFQFLGSLAQIMMTAQSQRFARAFTISNTAWPRWFAACHWITMPPPSLVMHTAPASCMSTLAAFIDATNLIHLRSHLIVARWGQEINS